MVAQILLIEDDVELSREIKEALTRRGFDCRDCGTIAAATAALWRQRPDVVLSDVCLPDGDGVQFFREHRSALPHTRWLLMSGNRDLSSRQDVPEITVFDKPVSWRTLIDFIRQVRNDWSR
jgi:DNA-binding NtrC family response regulator